MCRQNHLWGCAVMTFGLGILIGMLLESGLLCCLLGVGLILLGLFFLKGK